MIQWGYDGIILMGYDKQYLTVDQRSTEAHKSGLKKVATVRETTLIASDSI